MKFKVFIEKKGGGKPPEEIEKYNFIPSYYKLCMKKNLRKK